MRLTLAPARESDAAAIAALRNAAANHLTSRCGRGHWSRQVTERGVRSSMRQQTLLVGRARRRIVAVLSLGTNKPWAIDVTLFSPCQRPLYLTDMAVAPDCQDKGIGRRCIDHAIRVARDWPADAIRLDAYDAAAGAGGFYAKCGFVKRGRAIYRGTPHVYYELLLGGPDAVAPEGRRRSSNERGSAQKR